MATAFETETALRMGILTLEVPDTDVDVRSFAFLVYHVDLLYERLAVRMFVIEAETQAVLAALDEAKHHTAAVGMASPGQKRGLLWSTNNSFRAANPRLMIQRMHIGSPGFLEFLGALNPLVVIKDFVNDWQNDNRERQGAHRTRP